MWASRAEVQYLRERVRQLEQDLKDERTENRRVERHYGNMLLRRAGTFPVPLLKPAQQDEPAFVPQVSETDLAKAEAIRAEGKRMNKQKDEIEAAVRAQTGMSEQELARAIAGNGNG